MRIAIFRLTIFEHMCVVNSVLLTLLELLLPGLVLLLFAPDLVLPLLDVRHALE